MIYTVSSELYQEVLARLCDAIDGDNYFSGTIAFRFAEPNTDGGQADGTDCRLTASVLVFREPESHPEGIVNVIFRLVPVWWEFHTTDAEGEQINDFMFSELQRYL